MAQEINEGIFHLESQSKRCGAGNARTHYDNGSAKRAGKERKRKIFVGGFDYKTTQEEFKTHFRKYGEILSIHLSWDKRTKRNRGFGFVVYDDKSSLNRVDAGGPHIINGKEVQIKRQDVLDPLKKRKRRN